jgi:hypothetical protein
MFNTHTHTHTHTQYIYIYKDNHLILKERNFFVGKTYIKLKFYFCKISKIHLKQFFWFTILGKHFGVQ